MYKRYHNRRKAIQKEGSFSVVLRAVGIRRPTKTVYVTDTVNGESIKRRKCASIYAYLEDILPNSENKPNTFLIVLITH